MVMTPRTIPAAEFKAHCLALMDEVQASGEEIVVTKRGKPVARILPAAPATPPDLSNSILWFSDDFEAPLHEPWYAWQDE